jgi:hypothetical protein
MASVSPYITPERTTRRPLLRNRIIAATSCVRLARSFTERFLRNRLRLRSHVTELIYSHWNLRGNDWSLQSKSASFVLRIFYAVTYKKQYSRSNDSRAINKTLFPFGGSMSKSYISNTQLQTACDLRVHFTTSFTDFVTIICCGRTLLTPRTIDVISLILLECLNRSSWKLVCTTFRRSPTQRRTS